MAIRKRGFWIGLFLFFGIIVLPTPAGLTDSAWLVAAVAKSCTPKQSIKSSIADVAPFPEKSTTSRAALPVTFAFVPSATIWRASARNAVLWEPVRLVLVCVFPFC